MRKVNMMFFGIPKILWWSVNIASQVFLVIYAIERGVWNLIQGKKWDKKEPKWPEFLKIGRVKLVLPSHVLMMGFCALYIVNPIFAKVLIFRVFMTFVILEFLGIILMYVHKWTDKAGIPLQTSSAYDEESESLDVW